MRKFRNIYFFQLNDYMTLCARHTNHHYIYPTSIMLFVCSLFLYSLIFSDKYVSPL